MNVDYTKCPVSYMKDGLKRYIENGIPAGSFMTAMLANDFLGAVMKADATNLLRLRDWALFIANDLPDECWGSYEKVENWKGLDNEQAY